MPVQIGLSFSGGVAVPLENGDAPCADIIMDKMLPVPPRAKYKKKSTTGPAEGLAPLAGDDHDDGLEDALSFIIDYEAGQAGSEITIGEITGDGMDGDDTSEVPWH